MTSVKIKIPVILLAIDIFLIILMHTIGAYLDTFEKCRGFMGAVAPCVEGYFYGYLYFAYTIIPFLVIVTAVNWVDFRKKGR